MKGCTFLRRLTETVVFFDKKIYNPDKDTIEKTLRGASVNNYCSGWNIDRIYHGEIRVYYNPLVHKHSQRKDVEGRLKDSIKASAWGQ